MKKHLLNLDQKVFKSIDVIKARLEYKKFQDLLGLIEDDYRSSLAIISTIIFIALPFIGMLVLSSKISTIETQIDQRKEYIKTAGELFGNKDIVLKAAPQFFSTFEVSNFSSFQSLISRVAQTISIESSKIRLSGYDSQRLSQDITRSEVMMQVKDFSNLELSNILNGLVLREKIKIAALDLIRNEKTGRIDGTLKLIHFGKAGQENMIEEEL
jgi:hypothetical protein